VVTVDALAMVASESGIVDRALVLVDPAGTIGSVSGRITIPQVANPGFGGYLVRRNEARRVRVGMRLEY
jgi:hypothetical protein